MSETMTDGLTERERDHLEVFIAAKSERREKDSDLRTLADWREFLFCAASNLECDPPQSQPGIAAELRKLADRLVTLDLAASDLTTVRFMEAQRAKAKRSHD